MIRLTRLDGASFILNAELIRYIEALPDTYVTTVPGERVLVKESMEEVAAKALEYQRAKHLLPSPAPSRRQRPQEVKQMS